MDGIETPTIDRYVEMNAREVARAHREFSREYRMWLEAYRSHDVKRIQELAKARDLKARKVGMACHQADRFLEGLCGLLEVRY